MVERNPTRTKRFAIAIAAAGIVIELTAIALLASERLPPAAAIPLIVIGMFMAFVPIFMATRARRR